MTAKKKKDEELFIEYDGKKYGVKEVTADVIRDFARKKGIKKIDVLQDGKKIGVSQLDSTKPVKIVPEDWAA